MVTPSYLFDANAVIDLLDAADYDSLFDESTLDLMFYEATNAFWKIAAGEGKISRGEGKKFVTQLENLAIDMYVFTTGKVGLPSIYEMAWDTGLTGYDAAYVATADSHDLTLVTSDGGIHENAPEDVNILRVGEL